MRLLTNRVVLPPNLELEDHETFHLNGEITLHLSEGQNPDKYFPKWEQGAAQICEIMGVPVAKNKNYFGGHLGSNFALATFKNTTPGKPQRINFFLYPNHYWAGETALFNSIEAIEVLRQLPGIKQVKGWVRFFTHQITQHNWCSMAQEMRSETWDAFSHVRRKLHNAGLPVPDKIKSPGALTEHASSEIFDILRGTNRDVIDNRQVKHIAIAGVRFVTLDPHCLPHPTTTELLFRSACYISRFEKSKTGNDNVADICSNVDELMEILRPDRTKLRGALRLERLDVPLESQVDVRSNANVLRDMMDLLRVRGLSRGRQI